MKNYKYLLEGREYLSNNKKEDRNLARIRARRIARKAGLGYWPALLGRPKVDVNVYVMAEEICHDVYQRETGKSLPKYDLPFGESHGVWDSQGRRGISPEVVNHLWRKYGSISKFKIAIGRYYQAILRKNLAGARAILEAPAGLSLWELVCYAKGIAWLHANRLCVEKFSTQAVIALGRLSPVSRWAAIEGVEDHKGKIRARHLNWKLVKKVKGKISLLGKHTTVPNGLWWNTFFPELSIDKTVRKKVNFSLVRPGALKRMLEEFGTEHLEAVIVLSRLFGKDVAAAKAHIREIDLELKTFAYIDLPNEPFAQGWGKWFVSHPSTWKWTSMVSNIEKELGGRIPRNMTEFNTALEAALKKDIRRWLVAKGVDGQDINKYIKLFGKPHKRYEAIPNVLVSRDGYQLKKLSADDKRQPMVGLMTDCCQHLGGAASACAKAAWRRGDCAIWALFDRRGEIAAQSFVWRSDEAIVLDSLEAKRDFCKQWVAEMFKDAATQAIGRLGIKEAYVGVTEYGFTPMILEYGKGKPKKPPKPLEGEIGYSDAETVMLIASL